MQILTVDVGTGTQDILLFDPDKTIENYLKLVMPSPTAIVAGKIREGTARGDDILLNAPTFPFHVPLEWSFLGKDSSRG